MAKIAAGLVLVPPEDIVDLCVRINERAFENGRGRFKLGRDDYIPHITLAIGCIHSSSLDRIVSDFFYAIKSQRSIPLQAQGIELYRREDGNRSFLQTNIPPELRTLHDESSQLLSVYSENCDSASCLFDGNKTGMTDSTYKTLREFSKLYGGENYNPHITLGCYDADQFSQDIQFPIQFEASRFALFHLGNNCTARRKLFEAEFG